MRSIARWSAPLLLCATAAQAAAASPHPAAFAVQTVALPDRPGGMAVADLNGDGKPDFVVEIPGFPTSSVEVYSNATAPGAPWIALAPATSLNIPAIGYGYIAVADFNGDGKPDLIFGGNDALYVFLNTTPAGSAAATFGPMQTLALPGAAQVIAADINGDGKPDLLVVTLQQQSRLVALLNATSPGTASARFADAVAVFSETDAVRFLQVLVRDMNGDGRPDVLAPGFEQFAILLDQTAGGSDTPSFSQQTFSGTAVAIGDADDDGKPDVILNPQRPPFDATVLANTTPANASQVSLEQRQGFSVLEANGSGGVSNFYGTADLNADGAQDIVGLNTYAGELSIFLGAGKGASKTFTRQDLTGINVADFRVQWADLNADGLPDFAVVDADSHQLILLVNTTGHAIDPDQRGLTGSWYNPLDVGQGFEFEMYPDVTGPGVGQMFAGWFTYDVSQSFAVPRRWYGASGAMDRTSASAQLQLFDLEGGNLAAPPALGPAPRGDATLTFSSCQTASLDYRFDDGRQRSIPLSRLTPNTNCSDAGAGDAQPDLTAFSGNWFEPDMSGQGFMFDFAPSIHTVFAAWYTFSAHGQSVGGAASQDWFTLQSDQFFPGMTSLNAIPIVDTSGGSFESNLPVKSIQVGSADVALTSCNSMTLAYRFTAGANAGATGTLHLQRAGPVPAQCSL